MKIALEPVPTTSDLYRRGVRWQCQIDGTLYTCRTQAGLVAMIERIQKNRQKSCYPDSWMGTKGSAASLKRSRRRGAMAHAR
jgi:hypothetical protein